MANILFAKYLDFYCFTCVWLRKEKRKIGI